MSTSNTTPLPDKAKKILCPVALVVDDSPQSASSPIFDLAPLTFSKKKKSFILQPIHPFLLELPDTLFVIFVGESFLMLPLRFIKRTVLQNKKASAILSLKIFPVTLPPPPPSPSLNKMTTLLSIAHTTIVLLLIIEILSHSVFVVESSVLIDC